MQCNRSKQAFTLPEVVITSVIVLILLIPISRIAYSTLVSTKFSRDIGSALSAGQEKIESFSDLDYADISSGTSSEGKYSLAWTVTTQDAAKIVRLTVRWNIVGKTREITLNSIFADTVPDTYSFGP